MARLWICPNGHGWSGDTAAANCPVCGVALPEADPTDHALVSAPPEPPPAAPVVRGKAGIDLAFHPLEQTLPTPSEGRGAESRGPDQPPPGWELPPSWADADPTEKAAPDQTLQRPAPSTAPAADHTLPQPPTWPPTPPAPPGPAAPP